MQHSTRHVLVGVVVSIFLSPFVGGGVAGYLNGSDVRKGIVMGGIIGTIVGSVVSVIILLYTYYGMYQPLSALKEGMVETHMMELILPYLVAAVLVFAFSIISALVGGAIGSYVAGHEPPNAGDRRSGS